MIQINYLAILVAAVINMAVGALWYSPAMFGKVWMKLMGFEKRSMEDMKKGMRQKYAMMFAGALVNAFVLAWFIKALGVQSLVMGFRIGFLAWLGFTGTASFGNWIFSGKPKELFVIDTSYFLVVYCIIGSLLAVWK